MKAYKFLRPGAVSPITRWRWPAKGEWALAHATPQACRAGIHACRGEDLAHWICEELWEIELEGEITTVVDGVAGSRARLVRRVDAWEREQGAFRAFCVERARELFGALSGDLTRAQLFLSSTENGAAKGYTAWCAYAAASVAGELGTDRSDAYRAERAVQSAWIVRHVLDPDRVALTALET